MEKTVCQEKHHMWSLKAGFEEKTFQILCFVGPFISPSYANSCCSINHGILLGKQLLSKVVTKSKLNHVMVSFLNIMLLLQKYHATCLFLNIMVLAHCPDLYFPDILFTTMVYGTWPDLYIRDILIATVVTILQSMVILMYIVPTHTLTNYFTIPI